MIALPVVPALLLLIVFVFVPNGAGGDFERHQSCHHETDNESMNREHK